MPPTAGAALDDPVLPSGWQAELQLGFTRRGERTRLGRRRHCGPLQVQRPFYPEADGNCHVYILHPPGGVVGGDRLATEVELDPASTALLTTPAATKFYRSAGPTAMQRQNLRAARDATLEWLPQETILYAGARLDSETRIDLADEARFIGWEIVCLGRPAAGEGFHSGACDLRLSLWREGVPLLLERQRLAAGDDSLTAYWGLRGQPVWGTLLASPVPAGSERRLTELTAATDPGFSVTTLAGVLVCRYLGPSANHARRLFTRVWERLRPALLGKPACPPRVWST